MLIGGKKVDAGDGNTIDVINPATGAFIDTVPMATKEDVDKAVALSKIGMREWSAIPLFQREKIIDKFLRLMEEHTKEIVATLANESGKSVNLPFFELSQLRTLFKGYIETAKRYDGKVLVPGTELGHDGHTSHDLVMTIYEPIGTVACIVPFNAPLLQSAFKIAPALAAGNAAIVKPATDNPLAVIKMVELLWEAGVPGGAVQVVTGRGSSVGNWLVSNPGVDAVSMTGSTGVGIDLAVIMAKRLAPCCLELGGNDPFIVFEDADVPYCAELACTSKLGNAGQVCIAPKRFLIQNSIIDEFTNLLVEHVSKVEMGFSKDIEADIERFMHMTDFVNSKVTMGCLINENAAKTVEAAVELTVRQGAKIAIGGKRDGAFFEPTVLTGVTKDMDIAKDLEVFGPVFPIIGFDTAEDAIAIANNSAFGLSGNVMTADWRKGMTVARAVQSGSMVVNGSGKYRQQMQPFGGYKMSGVGREGLVTLGEMVQEKTIVLKGFIE